MCVQALRMGALQRQQVHPALELAVHRLFALKANRADWRKFEEPKVELRLLLLHSKCGEVSNGSEGLRKGSGWRCSMV